MLKGKRKKMKLEFFGVHGFIGTTYLVLSGPAGKDEKVSLAMVHVTD